MSKCLKCLNFRSAHPSWYHTQSSNSILLKTAVLLAAGTSLGCLLQPSTRGLLRARSLRSTVLVFTFSNHSSACSCPADWGKEKVLINMACKRRVQLSSGKEATSFYLGSNPKAHSPGNLTSFLEQLQVICPQHKGCPAKGELGYAILSLSGPGRNAQNRRLAPHQDRGRLHPTARLEELFQACHILTTHGISALCREVILENHKLHPKSVQNKKRFFQTSQLHASQKPGTESFLCLWAKSTQGLSSMTLNSWGK